MSQLTKNTASLQAVIDAINALPEAGAEQEELENPGSASTMLSGTEMLDGEGKKVIGTMPDNGAISSTMDGLEIKSVSIPAGYTSGGTVALDSTIDNTANSQATQIDEIMELLEGKSAGDGGSGGAALETCTVTVTGCKDVYYTSVENGAIVAKSSTGTSIHATHNIVVCKNSTVTCGQLLGGNFQTTGAELLSSYIAYYGALKVTADAATITTTSNGASVW